MSKRRNHKTTKNTMAKPPVTRLCVIEGECNGKFKIVTDFTTPKEQAEFDKIYREWFDHPNTRIWNVESFIFYFKAKFPNRMCVLQEDFNAITKGKVTRATKEEWEIENN